MKKVLKIFITLLLLIAICGCAGWYLYTHKNIGINKEYILRKTVKQYSDLIDVGLYDQAFNEFLTPAAQAKVEVRDVTTTDYSVSTNCLKLNSGFTNLFCDHPVTHTKVDIPALETFKKYADNRKNQWEDFHVNKIVFTGKDRADIQFVYKNGKDTFNAPETWYLQNGKWLRDF